MSNFWWGQVVQWIPERELRIVGGQEPCADHAHRQYAGHRVRCRAIPSCQSFVLCGGFEGRYAL